jgi:hypothetical protein
MRPTAIFAYAVCLAWITEPAPSNAEIYTWVDDKGVTHYSDSNANAPADHQQVSQELPFVHQLAEPDPALTRTLSASERERQQRLPSASQSRASRSNRTSCASYQRQLDNLQAKLRRGYREPRGNKLREKRRRLQARYNAECR